MGLETLIYIGIAAGFSFLSGKLLAKQQTQKVVPQPATLTSRGSTINFLRGKQRIAPVFAWAGYRLSDKHKDIKYYYERGWQILGVGPFSKLTRIWRDQKLFWKVGINKNTTPSGSYVPIGSRLLAGFYIHWGENDQPINSVLSGYLGIESRWPKTSFVLLNNAELTTGRWSEYLFECVCHGPDPEGTDGLQNSTRINLDDDSMNPAHVIWECLYQQWPDGCGIDQSYLIKEMFEEAGVTLETEGLWCNVVNSNNETMTEIIAKIMEDFGLMLMQRGNQLGLVAVRAIDYALYLDENQLSPSLPELEFNLLETSVNQISYQYLDAENEYAETDVKVDHDGRAIVTGTNPERVELSTVTSRNVANKIAERKSQEQLVGPIKYSITVNRAGRSLWPGDSVFISGIGKLRITSVKKDTMSTETTLEVAVDLYGLDLSGYLNGIQTIDTTGEGTVLKEDVYTDVIEMWREADNINFRKIVPLRLRRNNSSPFANILVSFDDGSSYETIDTINDVFAGGRLLTAIDETDNFIMVQGPIIYAANTDIQNVEDLSSDEISWLSGKQLCFINDEIFYLQKVTSFGGNYYRLDGLARARKDTVRKSHPVGSIAYIATEENVTPVYDARFSRNQTIKVKIQPRTDYAIVEADGIVANELEIKFRGMNPLSSKNVRCNDGFYYQTGQDFIVTWTKRKQVGSEYHSSMSGMQVSGSAVEDTSAPRDGKFRVEIQELWGFTRVTKEVDSDILSTTFIWADVLAEFGAIPNKIRIAVINILGGNESEIASTIIRKEN